MPNYADDYDVMMCEPPDNSIEESQFESACDSARDEFYRFGWLPCGGDAGDVDMELADRWPDALHQLANAEGDEAILAVAHKIIEMRAEIAEEFIADGVRAHDREMAEI